MDSVLHGSYNLETVLNFGSHLEKSLNSVEFLEKYLISLLGLEKSLKFTTLSKNIFVQNFVKMIVRGSLCSKKSIERSTYCLDSMKPKLCWPCLRSVRQHEDRTIYLTWLWRDLLLAPVVTLIWNLSLCSYTWPEACTESNITPHHKVDTPSQHQDFRGINVNPVIAKCFEKIVYHKFSNHAFEENLGLTQYAYWEGCNCTDVLINKQYNCLKALDDRECRYVRLFAMDFAKTSDNMKHSVFSDKLKAHNLNQYITNWYLSFL